jgi:hypothetical protein
MTPLKKQAARIAGLLALGIWVTVQAGAAVNYQAMVANFQKIHKGMSIQEVTALIGEPTQKEGPSWYWDFTALPGSPGILPKAGQQVFPGGTVVFDKTGRVDHADLAWIDATGPAPSISSGKPKPDPDEKFKSVVLNSFEKHACSPKPPGDSFEGIVISAPRRVSFKAGERVGPRGAFAAIPVCGYYSVPASTVPPGKDLTGSIRLVVRDYQAHQEYSGMMIDPDPPPPAKDVPLPDAKEQAGLRVGGYFNPNLADTVALPAKPATYAVQAELGGFKSNIVRVVLVHRQ